MTAAPSEIPIAGIPRPSRRRQADRSAAMRLQLIQATVASLIELGYARTTTVEVCRRAGVTRGALLHHFESLAELFAATLGHIYQGFLSGSSLDQDWPTDGRDLVEGLWRHFSEPEYKAVIELWLACRNEPELGAVLQPTILRIRDLADPRLNPRLLDRLSRSEEAVSFYRMALETMIGMALGRAVTPGGSVLGHEDRVVAMLARLAGEIFDESA